MFGRRVALVVCILCSPACGLLGPSCSDRRQGGIVTTFTGDVGAGQLVVHRLRYETQGSQNNIDVAWDGQSATAGPRLRFYVTRIECTSFDPPPAAGSPACSVLASGGAMGEYQAGRLIVTNGRGNPDVLGTPAEFLLWVVGDVTQGARYSVTSSWFYGPDC